MTRKYDFAAKPSTQVIKCDGCYGVIYSGPGENIKSVDHNKLIHLAIRDKDEVGWWANLDACSAECFMTIFRSRDMDIEVPTESKPAPKEPPRAGERTMKLLESD